MANSDFIIPVYPKNRPFQSHKNEDTLYFSFGITFSSDPFMDSARGAVLPYVAMGVMNTASRFTLHE